MKHYNLIIKGKVQGVFFRASTRDQARRHGVNGIVRNEPDGSVYIECEGDEESVKKFIAWCRQGPPAALVEEVEIEEGESRNYESFRIL